MPKSFIRLAVFVLIPCLVLDPAVVSAYSQPGPVRFSTPQERFSEEALSPLYVLMRIAASPLTILFDQQFGSMAFAMADGAMPHLPPPNGLPPPWRPASDGRNEQKPAQNDKTRIDKLYRMAENADAESPGHTERVGRYAAVLGKALGMLPGEVEQLRKAAQLHDIGKSVVDENILAKPGKPTDEERRKIELHPAAGAGILKNTADKLSRRSPLLQMAGRIALHHHEWWNGDGYPYGLEGEEEIPFEARIVAVVDVFDALTQDRPYRKALPVYVALQMIAEEAGTHFDPEVARVFLSEETQRHIEQIYDASPAGQYQPEGEARLLRRVVHNAKNPMQAVGNALWLILNSPISPKLRNQLLQAQERYKRIARYREESGGHNPKRRAVLKMIQPLEELMIIIKIAKINPSAYSSDVAEHLEAIERASTSAMDLLHLIDRPGTRVSFEINTALGGIVKDFRDYGAGKIQLRELYASESLRVSADSVQINEVVLNLLSNACDSIGDRSDGQITVTTGRDSQGGVFIRVEDNGKGIPLAHLPYIFDSFFTTKSQEISQTIRGIGLATVKQIIEEHGGKIEVESEPGKGARFTIHLPAADQAATSTTHTTPQLVGAASTVENSAMTMIRTYEYGRIIIPAIKRLFGIENPAEPSDRAIELGFSLLWELPISILNPVAWWKNHPGNYEGRVYEMLSEYEKMGTGSLRLSRSWSAAGWSRFFGVLAVWAGMVAAVFLQHHFLGVTSFWAYAAGISAANIWIHFLYNLFSRAPLTASQDDSARPGDQASRSISANGLTRRHLLKMAGIMTVGAAVLPNKLIAIASRSKSDDAEVEKALQSAWGDLKELPPDLLHQYQTRVLNFHRSYGASGKAQGSSSLVLAKQLESAGDFLLEKGYFVFMVAQKDPINPDLVYPRAVLLHLELPEKSPLNKEFINIYHVNRVTGYSKAAEGFGGKRLLGQTRGILVFDQTIKQRADDLQTFLRSEDDKSDAAWNEMFYTDSAEAKAIVRETFEAVPDHELMQTVMDQAILHEKMHLLFLPDRMEDTEIPAYLGEIIYTEHPYYHLLVLADDIDMSEPDAPVGKQTTSRAAVVIFQKLAKELVHMKKLQSQEIKFLQAKKSITGPEAVSAIELFRKRGISAEDIREAAKRIFNRYHFGNLPDLKTIAVLQRTEVQLSALEASGPGKFGPQTGKASLKLLFPLTMGFMILLFIAGLFGIHLLKPPQARAATAIETAAPENVPLRISIGKPTFPAPIAPVMPASPVEPTAQSALTAITPEATLPFAALIRAKAIKHHLSPVLVNSIVQVESHFNTKAESEHGALGLMQIKPDTAKMVLKGAMKKAFKPATLYQADTNLETGTSYLESLTQQFPHNVVAVIVGYKEGAGAAKKALKEHPNLTPEDVTPDVARDYVYKVLAHNALAALSDDMKVKVDGLYQANGAPRLLSKSQLKALVNKYLVIFDKGKWVVRAGFENLANTTLGPALSAPRKNGTKLTRRILGAA